MINTIRFNEYKVLLYRILIAYLFYFIARALFVLFNQDLLEINSFTEFISLSYYGLIFDTSAIFYVNFAFVVFSLFPLLQISTSNKYQSFLFYIYFSFNLIAYATNFMDMVYYKFIDARSTLNILDSIKYEDNKNDMVVRFFTTYWYLSFLFIIASYFWIYLYKKVRIKNIDSQKYNNKITYFVSSTFALVCAVLIMIAGIRGGNLTPKTMPINLVDANRYVSDPKYVSVVLNTPFSLIRTISSKRFNKVQLVDDSVVQKYIKPIKQYNNNTESKPNIVLFILESFGKEYISSFNKDSNIPNYKGYTPFLDSIAQHSLLFTNSFANGRKSIHGVPAIMAGIPSFKEAYISSSYTNQKTQSLVSCLEEMGYQTSFFHGSHNGSMFFLGFNTILGTDKYFGKTEFNNDAEFDGSWGIWDEPFLQFMESKLNTQKQPFFATAFTLSSHEPYNVPEKYKNKFIEGNLPIYKSLEYTDFALRNFFEAAKKEEWFNNTIFIFTADHCNQPYYDEYKKNINRFAIPIIIYKPDGSFSGTNNNLAQQIDIYPTILDLIGYNKPFRSWGRSLVGDSTIKPYTINFSNNLYQLQRGNYITTFNGKTIVGHYDINDKDLKNNLISNTNTEMIENEEVCKAFVQDYFNKIIDKKLNNR